MNVNIVLVLPLVNIQVVDTQVYGICQDEKVNTKLIGFVLVVLTDRTVATSHGHAPSSNETFLPRWNTFLAL
eukprot:12585351-Ditylum_brightwellii.AAC.1